MIDINLYNCQIGFGIGTNDFGVVLHTRGIAVELHANAVGLIDYVLIGDDVSLRIDNHARTK